MLTPNGVNYLLQFLQYFFQFPNCPKQESKVERHDMSLLCRYVIIRSTIFELYHYRLISPTPPNLFLRDNG
jgi:hypothetical protein